MALQAHVEDEQHAGVLLAFEHVTTGFGWSRPGRSALFANTVYTLLPRRGRHGRGRARAGWRRCAPASPPTSDWWPGSAVRPTPRCCRPAAARPTSAWHCTPLSPELPPVAYDESWDRIVLRRLRAVTAAGRMPERGPVDRAPAARPAPRDPPRRDPAGLAGRPRGHRCRRGDPRRPPEHRAVPPAEDGRGHSPRHRSPRPATRPDHRPRRDGRGPRSRSSRPPGR